MIRHDKAPAGCGGVKLFGTDYAEMERTYVRPSFRGLGPGRLMGSHLEEYARNQGVGLLRLETGIYQRAVTGLCERVGLQRSPAFGEYEADPISVYFEKRIG